MEALSPSSSEIMTLLDTCAVELLSKKELARREVSRRAISPYAYRAELLSRESGKGLEQ
jgi:hypothetical protein